METTKPTDSVDTPSKELVTPTTSARAAATKPAGDIIGAVNPQNQVERDDDEKEKEDTTAETRKDKTSARQSLASRLSRESQQNNSFRGSGNDFYSSLFDLAHLNPYYYNYMSYAYSPQARLAASNATLQLAMENYWAQMATTNSYFTPNFAANYYSSTPNYQPTKTQQQRVTINLHSSLQKDTKSRPSQSEELGNATTLMLRNIPNRYTRDMLLKEFENHGVMKGIDFFYLPMDIRYKCNVGYCFVNLASAKAVRKFVREFDNTKLDQVQSEKICQLSRAKVQGKEANIEQYRNSAVVTMSEEFQPMIFKNGRSLPFPKPTDDGAKARESRNTRSSKATHTSNDRAGRSKKGSKQEFQPPERSSKKGGKKGQSTKKLDQKEQTKEHVTKKTGKKGQASRESERTDKKEQSPRKGKKAQSPKVGEESSPKVKESVKKSEKKEPSPKKSEKKEPSPKKNDENEPSPKKSEKNEQSPQKEQGETKNAKIKHANKEKVDTPPKKSRSSKKSNDKDTQASKDSPTK